MSNNNPLGNFLHTEYHNNDRHEVYTAGRVVLFIDPTSEEWCAEIRKEGTSWCVDEQSDSILGALDAADAFCRNDEDFRRWYWNK